MRAATGLRSECAPVCRRLLNGGGQHSVIMRRAYDARVALPKWSAPMSKRPGRLMLLGVVSALIGSAKVEAQASAPATRARIGVMAGVNLATLAGNDVDDAENRIGALGGLSYVRNWGGATGLEMDILYSAKGVKSVDGSDEFTLKLNYIEIPVLLRYDFPSSGAVRPHVSIGPSLAFRASCGAETTSGGASISVDCDGLQEGLDVKLKSLDVGAALGAGLDFAMGRRTFTVGAR